MTDTSFRDIDVLDYNDEKEKKIFQNVYEFATENVSGYFSKLDLCDKTLLTVGSSLDQAFNALVLGVKNVVVYDINCNTNRFYKIKKNLLLNNSRENFIEAVKQVDSIPIAPERYSIKDIIRMNNYLQNDDNYNLLRERLIADDIEIINGDIFDMNRFLDNRKFDRITFSNVLQYLELFANNKDIYRFLADNFSVWKDHLNDQGILQLFYLYSFSSDDLKCNNHNVCCYNMSNVINALGVSYLGIDWIPNFNNAIDDAIVTYKKR